MANKKGGKRKDLTKEQILLAMRHTKSNHAAARYLLVSYTHYKRWAKLYNSDIKVNPDDPDSPFKSLFEVHNNPHGKGIPKFGVGKNAGLAKINVIDIVEGRVSHTHFKPEQIKIRLIEEGILKEECALCGFCERRVSDFKIPLILHFKDGNCNHYNLGNIRFLCYNHYFLTVSDIFNKKDIKQLETHNPTRGTTDAIDFQLDDYQKKQLENLGLYEPPKPDLDDGSELISRS